MHLGCLLAPTFFQWLNVDNLAAALVAMLIGDGEVVVGHDWSHGCRSLWCLESCQIDSTVSELVKKLAAADVAVVLFDTEGEYKFSQATAGGME